jgi:hypothetical protein
MSSFAAPSFSTACGRRSSSSTVCTSSAAMGGFPGRPAGRPGAQPGPDPGPVLRGGRAGLPPIHVRLDGPGRDSARHRAPGRAGPGAGSHDGGFDDRPGWRLRGFPSSGRRAPPALFSPAWVFLLLRLPCLVCLCLVVPARALGADRGRARCLDAFARLSGSLAAPRGYSCAGLRPLFFASSSALARAGPGPSASSPAGAAGRD